jgi:hypothetical protein
MKNYLKAHDKTDCAKCRYSRRIPLSSQLTCTHPLADVWFLVAGTYEELKRPGKISCIGPRKRGLFF